MAISIYSNRGIKNYGIKHFILDTNNDLQKLSTSYIPGSTAFIVENSKYYMLNNSHVWCEVSLGNGGGGNGSYEDIDLLIYDGGHPFDSSSG